MVTRNLPVDEELVKAYEELAKRTGKPVDVVVADGLREHLHYTERFLASLEAGIADADAGRTMSIDDAEQMLARRRAAKK